MNRSCSIASHSPPALPIIDGHNDTLLNLLLPARGGGRDFLHEDERGHIDLPRAHRGGMAGGFFAMFTPSESQEQLIRTDDGYEVTLADVVAHDVARDMTERMLALLEDLIERSAGRFQIARDTAAIRFCLANDVLFAIPHIEGAEAIAPDLSNLESLYDRGIRSLGIVWSRPNDFGHGVPYAYPRTPDTGPGLTDAGREVVQECNRLGIMLDLSHLNLAGFIDVARISDAPLVATHSCVHRICPVTRNLTDEQVDAIGASGGLIGIAFDVTMIRPDGWLETDTPIDVIVDHIDYVAGRIGIEHVALGSDFDGAVMPTAMRDVSGVPLLIDGLRERGYDDPALRLITHENWLRVLEATWRPKGDAQPRH